MKRKGETSADGGPVIVVVGCTAEWTCQISFLPILEGPMSICVAVTVLGIDSIRYL